MSLFFQEAFAEGAKAATNQTNPIMTFMPFVLIFGIFYFLIIRPQKKKMQQEEAMISSLNKGDEVFTKCGIIGTIHGLTDKVVTLEVSDGVKLKIVKGQIAGPAKKIFEGKEEKK